MVQQITTRNIHEPIDCPEDDRLGRQALADIVWARLLERDCPQTIGIYGGWGTGKTSLLNLISRLNEVDNYLQIIIVDAWQYENTGNLIAPILTSINKLLTDTEAKDKLMRILKVASLGFFEIALRKSANMDLDDVQRLVSLTQAVDEINDAKLGFSKVVNQALRAKDRKRLVLCVDNLDRCLPENTVNLLESVKNFLSVPNCVWIFAMDSGVIASFINQKYAGTAMDGYSYLDKIIQEQYHLSTPLSHEMQNRMDQFVDSLLAEFAGRTNLHWKHYAHIPKVLAPRRIIKCAGTLRNYLNASIPHHARDDTIFSLIMLYHTWPDFYEHLSFGESGHILGVLNNFYIDTNLVGTTGSMVVPLDEKYTKDQELTHFLRKAYLDSPNIEQTTNELADGLFELRLIGLP